MPACRGLLCHGLLARNREDCEFGIVKPRCQRQPELAHFERVIVTNRSDDQSPEQQIDGTVSDFGNHWDVASEYELFA